MVQFRLTIIFGKSFLVWIKLILLNIDTTKEREYLIKENIGLICYFDNTFPKINFVKKYTEKPFLFLYKGNIDLLEDKNNIAVIGTLNPSEEIVKREEKLIKALIKENKNIVSGLAKGCDSIAHKTCLIGGGKTIAILPTTFNNIYPKENESLLNEIIEKDGLVITEYVNEPKNRYENINRFIMRDRLQAMFSSAVILVASHVKGKGDSGSRHAMEKAKEYNKKRFVMFNPETDKYKEIFELNYQLSLEKDVKIINIKEIKNLNVT